MCISCIPTVEPVKTLAHGKRPCFCVLLVSNCQSKKGQEKFTFLDAGHCFRSEANTSEAGTSLSFLCFSLGGGGRCCRIPVASFDVFWMF